MAKDLQVGDIVKMKEGDQGETAKVEALMRHEPGGVILDHPLGGMIYWIEDDLDYVETL